MNITPDILKTEEKEKILSAIKEAEKETSGEIRVHIENHCKIETLDRAAQIFAQLKMHKTELRNGVLFYIAIKDKKFAIVGDKGINANVPENFWDTIKQQMQHDFKQGSFIQGIELGIKTAGLQLKKHFPYKSNDVNELSDEISFEHN
ncbi:MAG: TPM domain-containing protein [Chitinophagaceae bacterium]|nr:TPM domain-containing protein [Chitinophagaceae bacterium]